MALLEGTFVDGQVLANHQEWVDVEFEVALDSGCTDHVCAEEDVPGYVVVESPGSRAGQHFVVGNGARIANTGQSCLHLEATSQASKGNAIKSTFQIAKVSRPLMSVGKICDGGLDVLFGKTKADVKDDRNNVVCSFVRQPGGLYVAKLRLKSPFGRPA